MHTLRDSSVAAAPLAVLVFLLAPLGPPVALGQVVESTGFEADPADGGWEAGFPICGSTCDPGCGTNPNNGWYGASWRCIEPHISAENPFTGDQHLRFIRDYYGGNPPGCVGFGVDCRSLASTPSAGGPLPIGPTTISYNVAQGPTPAVPPWGGSLLYLGIADGDDSVEYHYFSYYGVAYAYDKGYRAYVPLGYSSGREAYDTIVVHIDPCEGTVRYDYGPMGNVTVGVHQQAAGMSGMPSWISRAIIMFDNDVVGWDFDDYSVVRGEPCTPTCGADGVEPGEECDHGAGEDENCPGRCILPGEEGECTCAGVGACCDRETGTCTEDLLAEECACDQCSWFEGWPCSAVYCESDAYRVPTLSWWGLAVLVILLLAGTARALSTRGQFAATPPRN